MNKIIEYFLWLIFPQRCAVCNKIIVKDRHLCKECAENIERIEKICTVCGSDKKYCVCKRRVFHFRGSTAVFNHGDFSKQAINFFKFRGNSEISNFLSSEMILNIKENFPDIRFDYVVPVPMHPFKRFIKGFNHSELLAKKIAKGLEVPYASPLKKLKYYSTQHRSTYQKRRENVKGLFLSENIYAKNVLLVDDIKTTGATLDECARQLMFSGAQNVYCATAISNNYRKSNVEKK